MDGFARDRVYAQVYQINPVFHTAKINSVDDEHCTQFQAGAVMLFPASHEAERCSDFSVYTDYYFISRELKIHRIY